MSKDRHNAFKAPAAITSAKRGPAIEKIIKRGTDGAAFAERFEATQVTYNPYYRHMPKNTPNAATIYTAEIGGEDSEIAECVII